MDHQKIIDSVKFLVMTLVCAALGQRLGNIDSVNTQLSSAREMLRALKRAVERLENEQQRVALTMLISSELRRTWHSESTRYFLTDAEIREFPKCWPSKLAPEWGQLFGNT